MLISTYSSKCLHSDNSSTFRRLFSEPSSLSFTFSQNLFFPVDFPALLITVAFLHSSVGLILYLKEHLHLGILSFRTVGFLSVSVSDLTICGISLVRSVSEEAVTTLLVIFS